MTAAGPRPQWMSGLSEVTVSRMEQHLALLRKWNSTINLVAPSSLQSAWTRHVQDSAQVFALRGSGCRHWVDLGSGAGFPGLVIASLAAEVAPEMRVTLVEADQRKAEFLRTVSRETGLAVTVHAERIEALRPLRADIVSARALAPLPTLCDYAKRHMVPSGSAIFLKGARAEEEVRLTQTAWRFDLKMLPSSTDPSSFVLVLKDLHRV